MEKKDVIPSEFDLWGEIPATNRNEISEEILGSLITGAIKTEDPKLKLPVVEDRDDDEEGLPLPKRLCKQNKLVLQTILLNEHAKSVETLIEALEGGNINIKPCPPIPTDSKIEEDEEKNVFYNFQLGQGPQFPQIDSHNIEKMLKKAVLVTIAETGFDKAHKQTVNVLIDVLRYILNKICRLLHHVSQPDAIKGRTQYKDTLEKTFQLLGMSGIRDVIDYYQKNVIGRREAAMKKSVDLMNRYNSLLNRMKDQSDSDTELCHLTEMNVSGINLNDSVKLPEPGFQMLFDLKTEPQPGPSTHQDYSSGSLAKTIIKKRISSNILQNRTKKSKTDT